MRIGVMGGTFDPPHLGHLLPVAEAAREYQLDEVWYIPNSMPPHKERPSLTDPFHRAAMVALAIESYPHFLLNTLELNKGKVSYTIETLLQLQNQVSPADSLFFILGSDSFLEIETWYRYSELIELCEFIIINRGNNEEDLKQHLERLENVHKRDLTHTFHFSHASYIPVSSTEIRFALEQSRSVSGMLSDEVEGYINKHRLYTRR